ncbi:hypothetical protein [Lentzea sp. NPDC003310]|uniref:hypothetical protein n=1 Tax=Lentzea sp. NPDC003310 TaxID=3154447 RepID=UPI0033AB3EBA
MTRVRVRLRPAVQATQTPDGLHLRGWASSCTLSGGSGLWKVWQRLAPQLEAGLPRADLEVPPGTAEPVRAAVALIVEQLWEHDMLVEMPEWGADAPAPEVAAWLESAAAEPVEAWRRLRAVTVVVTGRGLLGDAAVRAVEAVGVAVLRAGSTTPVVGDLSTAAPQGPEDVRTAPIDRAEAARATLATPASPATLSAGDLTLQAACGTEVGYALPPTTTLTSVNTEATTRITARLGLTGDPTEPLATLVACAAVHRLLSTVAGLPDPATTLGDSTYPMVLVARTNPLTATYHPLLDGTPDPDPWRALDALTDEELGPVDTPEFGDLPQVPANLATAGNALGIGTTADQARLNAALHALKSDGVLGLDDTHARGAALRHAVRHHRGEPADADEWTSDPTAHRWWKALTARFGVAAVIRTERLAPGVYRAEIGNGRRVLAWAVEATAADAVAFAALAATGYAQAGRDGTAHLNGAAPQQPKDQPEWVTRQWHWPADVRDREERLQQAIARIPGVRVVPTELDPELRAAGLKAYR